MTDRVEPFLQRIQKSFDIGSSDPCYIKKMEEICGVKMTQVEVEFHKDQVEGERKMYCDSFVDRRWQAQSLRRQREAESFSLRMERESKDTETLMTKVIMSSYDEEMETEELHDDFKVRVLSVIYISKIQCTCCN